MAITATQPWSQMQMSRAGSAWIGQLKFEVWFSGADKPGTPAAALDAVYTTFGIKQNVTAGSTEGAQYMYCQGIHADNGDKFGLFVVTANYSTTPAGRFPIPGDPLNEPIEYLWSSGQVSEQVDRDWNGNPIANTNGDVFSSLASRFYGVKYLTIRRNEATYDKEAGDEYEEVVNSDSPWTFGPGSGGAWSVLAGCALCKSISPMTEITSSSPYVRMQYDFEIRKPFNQAAADPDGLYDAFKDRRVNAGQRCYYASGSGGAAMGHIIYRGGQELIQVSQDVRLAANGTPVDSASFAVNGIGTQTPAASPWSYPGGLVTIETDDTGVVYLKFQMYGYADFAPFGF